MEILEWTDGSQTGFAYSHNGSLGASDFANGGLYTTGVPFVGGGNFYFTSNATPSDILATGEVAQLIDVSAGDSATTIAAGRGGYNLSAIFNTFLSQGDFGNLHLHFLDGSSDSLGVAEITPGGNVQEWTSLSATGDISIGTASVLVSVYAGGGNDGYLDNVDFEVLQGDAPLGLDIDLATGDAVMTNPNSVNPIEFDYYEITSAAGSLLATWESFDDQGLDALGGGIGQHWTEGAGVDSENLTEVFLLGTSVFSASETQTLANTFNTVSSQQDLFFRYGLASEGVLHEGVVRYSGTPPMFDLGDFDSDGDIDGNDWAILRTNQHTDLSGLTILQASLLGDMDSDRANNHVDFILFKEVFEVANGTGSFAAMLSEVPEPSTIVLISFAMLGLGPISRRSDSRQRTTLD